MPHISANVVGGGARDGTVVQVQSDNRIVQQRQTETDLGPNQDSVDQAGDGRLMQTEERVGGWWIRVLAFRAGGTTQNNQKSLERELGDYAEDRSGERRTTRTEDSAVQVLHRTAEGLPTNLM